MHESLGLNNRNVGIDILKGIAIIVVVLYHIGILDFGYLGVDLFFAINGYLITKNSIRSCEKDEFSYFRFIIKRLSRLWPLVVVACLVSSGIGCFTMLPDDLENLSESIIASNLFMNNILQAITTKNYWDISNNFKPLMHTWYLGILVQYYLIYPLILIISKKIFKSITKPFIVVLSVFSIISLILYIFSGDPSSRFYFLQYRFFEFGFGGLISFLPQNKLVKRKQNNLLYNLSVLGLLILFLSNLDMLDNKLKLIITILISCIGIEFSARSGKKNNIFSKIISTIGIGSYSVYIWHQIIFAFYRYIVRSEFEIIDFAICILITVICSTLSYFLVEKKIQLMINNKGNLKIIALGAIVSLVMCSSSFYLYLRAGVVRDIPELDIYTSNIHRGMHSEYNDRVRKMDVEFNSTEKIKILAIGDSFMRDWVNVLLESEYKEYFEISYCFGDDLTEDYISRIKEADYIFVNAYMKRQGIIPDYLYENLECNSELWAISTKRFGETNGNIYNRRFYDNYFQMTASYAGAKEEYEYEKKVWGQFLVDFIAPVDQGNEQVLVFTQDNKFISQDCRHLTRAGARYYSALLPIKEIFRISGDD